MDNTTIVNVPKTPLSGDLMDVSPLREGIIVNNLTDVDLYIAYSSEKPKTNRFTVKVVATAGLFIEATLNHRGPITYLWAAAPTTGECCITEVRRNGDS